MIAHFFVILPVPSWGTIGRFFLLMHTIVYCTTYGYYGILFVLHKLCAQILIKCVMLHTYTYLGVYSTNDLLFEEHMKKTINSSRVVSGMLLRTFSTREKRAHA